jgi:mannitol/fructose-specific phosphotransferase system IIA component (Ntr-type)
LLSDLIGKELIQLNVRAENWEDAIRKGTGPLVANKKVTEEYVNKIIEIAHTTGPYIVITKHVALPHAPSEFGALDTAIGITTLETPIEFGNEVNDPVKYLLCLSAKDSTSHLDAIAELVQLLEKEDFFQLLDNAKDPSEIIDYIKKSFT